MASQANSLSLALVSLFLISLPLLLRSQQPYGGEFIADCPNQHNSSSLLGYFCNGRSTSCQAYAAFSSQSPYQSVSGISALLGADPSQVSLANSVAQDATFPAGAKVLVPLDCSCSGAYYQSNASYAVISGDTIMRIANTIYQGLSTCQAIMYQNLIGPSANIRAGEEITVPVRCACPTSNQTSNGVNHLLSYLVDGGEFLDEIGERFGLTAEEIMDANELQDTTIYPSATLLIPLKKEPRPSQLVAPASPSPPPNSPPPPPPPPVKKDHKWLYAGIGVAVGVAVLLSLSLVVFRAVKANKRKPTKGTIRSNGKGNAQQSSTSYGGSNPDVSGVLSGITEIGQALKVYKLEELQLATKNFSNESRVAGSVYRGVLDGDVAAVKMVSRDVTEEISVLKKVNHFNLVKLSGICFNRGQWLLVYEYAENGSLNNWLFDSNGSKALNWVQRVQIALDVATGLNYLHSYTEPPHVHKDVKCSNILLDGRFRAKIANFAMARSAQGKEGEFTLTRHIIGTQGYMAPEYLEHGLVSPKLDVYALGVVMMEMITGTDVADAQGGGALLLSAFGAAALAAQEESCKVESLMDPSLQGNYPLEPALAMARLVECCLRKDAASRPTMEEIERALQTIFDMSLTWESSSVAKLLDSETTMPLVCQ